MAEAVLDASAILALLQGEPGAERVEAVIDRALISVVNVSEVLAKLIDKGASAHDAALIAASLPCRDVDMDLGLALACGQLRATTRDQGLSLGDRACLALATREALPVLTTDKVWATLDSGVVVDVIR